MVVIRIAIEKVEYIIILKHSILFWWVKKQHERYLKNIIYIELVEKIIKILTQGFDCLSKLSQLSEFYACQAKGYGKTEFWVVVNLKKLIKKDQKVNKTLTFWNC